MTKPSINWDHVAQEYKWLTMDNDGESILHAAAPVCMEHEGWWSSDGPEIAAHNFSSYTPGTCDWEDSLVQRPEAPND